MPVVLISSAMTTVYFPRLVELTAEGKNEAVTYLFSTFFKYVSSVSILIVAILIVYPRIVLGILYSERYLSSAPLLVLLVPVIYLYGLQTVLTFSIAAQGRLIESLPGAVVSTLILLIMLTLAATFTKSLVWFALAHSLSAGVGFVWQLGVIRQPKRELMLFTIRSAAFVIVSCLIVCMIVPDLPTMITTGIITLGVISVIYLAWIWHQAEERRL